MEIDLESENRAELARMEREATDSSHRTRIKSKIAKSDERIQSLAVLMLHYCAGLQNCLDTQELMKQDGQEVEQIANGLDQEVQQGEIPQDGIPKIVTEEPSIDDSDSSEDEPIYMKTDKDAEEMNGKTDLVS